MHGSDRKNQEIAPPRKPFGDLTNLRYLRSLKGDGYHTSRSPDAVFAAGPSKLIQPPLRVVQANRRVVSDPVYSAKERRRFLDPIKEAENELGNEERPTPGPRVRFRSKSVTAVIPPFLQARDHTPATGGSNSRDRAEDSSLESSVSILEILEKGETVKEMDDGMDTEELLRDIEVAFHSPPSSSTLRQAVSSKPTNRIKSILDTVVPESHSTPTAVKHSVIPRHLLSSHPTHLPPSDPLFHPLGDPPSEGIGMPRPKPLDTSFVPPQTHKVSRGQLVVLPSRSLLVDFREGERKQGRQGVEVFTISPNGEEVRALPRVLAMCIVHHPFRLMCSVPRT